MNQRQYRQNNMSEDEVQRSEIQKRRFIDPDEKKLFRNAYCFKAFNYATLKPFCEDIRLVVDGYGDHLDKIRAKFYTALENYDPDKDLIVPSGRAMDNLIVGTIITPKIIEKPKARQNYAIAVYQDYSYVFYQIYIDGSLDSYEILTK